jgi:hypothetical protein
MKPFLIVMAVATLNVCLFSEIASSEPLQGTWSGLGYLKPTDGQRQNVSCHVSYSPQGSKVVAVSATCASSSTSIHQIGQLSMGRARPLYRGVLQQRV